MEKYNAWLHNKRALSPIFATVLLVDIVIVQGSSVYYFAKNFITQATNDYSSTLSNSQQSISERLAVENVIYNSSSSKLSLYLINCGVTSNIQNNSVFIYKSTNSRVRQPASNDQISALKSIDTGALTAGNHILMLVKKGTLLLALLYNMVLSMLFI